MWRSWVRHLQVFAIYLFCSLGLLGWPILKSPAESLAGTGSDPSQFVWFFAWWPYAISHGVNPFLTTAVWAPSGVNLAWTTAIPGPSLLLSPVTYALGPVVSYNVASLLALTLSAWSMFVLCYHVTGAFGASLIGGYVFGFSTYEVSHFYAGHLNLTLVPTVPWAVYLVLRRLDATITRRKFTLLLTAALTFQFLTSTEIFATMTLLGGALLIIALWFAWGAEGRQLRATAGLIAAAYALTAVLVAPYLYYAFSQTIPRFPGYWPSLYSSDLANVLMPTSVNALGSRLLPVGSLFPGEADNTAYFGVPFVLIALFFALEFRQAPAGKLIVTILLVTSFLSLGPVVHVGGTPVLALPWRAATRAPLVDHILPARLALYTSMSLALMTAVWLVRSRVAWGVKWSLALLGVVFLLPSSPRLHVTAVDTPAFFHEGGPYRRYISAGENVLVVPYGYMGQSMLWQAQTNFYFRMAGGYVIFMGAAPEFRRWPTVATLYSGELAPGYAEDLHNFLRAHDVRHVIVADGTPGPWDRLFGALHTTPRALAGVTLYRVPPALAVAPPAAGHSVVGGR